MTHSTHWLEWPQQHNSCGRKKGLTFNHYRERLIMKTLTKKNAVSMAQNWVLSEATKRSTTEVIRSVCTLIICKDEKYMDKAGVFLATLFEEIYANDKKAGASFRTMLGRESKKIGKQYGKHENGLTVKDGRVIDIAPRNRQGASDKNEDGSARDSKQVQDINDDIKRLERIMNACDDVADRSALKRAIASMVK